MVERRTEGIRSDVMAAAEGMAADAATARREAKQAAAGVDALGDVLHVSPGHHHQENTVWGSQGPPRSHRVLLSDSWPRITSQITVKIGWKLCSPHRKTPTACCVQ